MTDLQNIRLTRESNVTAHKSGDIWFPTVFGHPRSESLAWQAFEFKERSVVSSVIGCYNRKVRGPLQGCRRTGFNFPLGSVEKGTPLMQETGIDSISPMTS